MCIIKRCRMLKHRKAALLTENLWTKPLQKNIFRQRSDIFYGWMNVLFGDSAKLKKWLFVKTCCFDNFRREDRLKRLVQCGSLTTSGGSASSPWRLWEVRLFLKEVARDGEQTRVLSISFIFLIFTTLPLSHSGSPWDVRLSSNCGMSQRTVFNNMVCPQGWSAPRGWTWPPGLNFVSWGECSPLYWLEEWRGKQRISRPQGITSPLGDKIHSGGITSPLGVKVCP
jgi:hypothetical protein